jgi:hypothetical protein
MAQSKCGKKKSTNSLDPLIIWTQSQPRRTSTCNFKSFILHCQHNTNSFICHYQLIVHLWSVVDVDLLLQNFCIPSSSFQMCCSKEIHVYIDSECVTPFKCVAIRKFMCTLTVSVWLYKDSVLRTMCVHACLLLWTFTVDVLYVMAKLHIVCVKVKWEILYWSCSTWCR